MSIAGKSVYVFGLYVILLGLTLMTVPNLLLGLFGIPGTTEVWIRVLGLVLFFEGFYFVQAPRHQMTEFFQWTVWHRALVVFVFTAFVLLASAPPALILFGIVDFLSAGWTWFALRSSLAAFDHRAPAV